MYISLLKYFLFTLTTFSSLLFYAQEKASSFNLKHGESYSIPHTETIVSLNINNVILSVSFENKKITLHSCDGLNLSLIKRNEYDNFPKKITIEKLLQLENHIYLFYSSFIDQIESLYVREIELESCSFKENAKVLFQLNKNVTSTLPLENGGVNFSFISSFDKTKLIVQYQQQITKKENATFGYKFLNGDLELLKEKEIEIPTLRNKIKHMDGVLDEENTMNLISFIYKNNKQSNKNVRGHINYDVQLIKIKIETGEISTQKVNIDSVYHINSLKFFQPNESSIICAGYASIIGLNNKFNKSSAAFKFDLLDTISKITYNLFPLALVNQNKSKSKASRNFSKQRRDGKYFNPSIPQLVPKMIHLTSDGGLLFVGEQKIPVGNGSSIGIGGGVGLAFAIAATRSKNSHNYIDYKDIICIKYNKNDSIEWSRKISKSQGNPYLETFYGLKTYGSSFNFIEGLEHIYFLYLDNKKNLTLNINKAPERQFTKEGGFLMISKMDPLSGEIEKIPVLNVGKLKHKKNAQFNSSSINVVMKGHLVFEITYNAKTLKEEVLGIFNDKAFLTRIKLK